MKILFVGDVHATPDELGDCERLFDLVEEVSVAEGVDQICLLGDSYHTFNVMRVEVLAFWRKTFKRLTKPVMALVGNHDYAGEGLSIHSMMAHEEQIQVIDRPVDLNGVLFMPYFSDRELFVKSAQDSTNTKTLVCHQTFAGSTYENGFYAPESDSVNPDLTPQMNIICGHIHSPQSFGKVTYIGAPRWRTLSDANTSRAIVVVTFDEEGGIQYCEKFDTGATCRQIRYIVDSLDEPFTEELISSVDWRIDIRGPEDYVIERKAHFTRPGVKVRCFPASRKPIVVKESEGVEKAFTKYVKDYAPRHGTSIETLTRMAKERLGL